MLIDEDRALVDRFRAGDSRAFDELVRKYQKPIFYLCLRYLKDTDDAKDAAQRAFVKAFRAIAQFRGDATFRTWIYRIAVNASLNHVRDRARGRGDELTEDVAAADAIGASRLVDAEAAQRLRAAVAELPPKQRTVLELRVFEELSFKEVAEIAECSENAAKVNFHHAVKRLRTWMSGRDEKKAK